MANDETFNMREMIRKFGLTQTEVLAAVREVGTSRDKVEAYLSAQQ